METPIDQIVYDQVVENGQGRTCRPSAYLSDKKRTSTGRVVHTATTNLLVGPLFIRFFHQLLSHQKLHPETMGNIL
jgi:hypothetical protein